MSNVGNLLEFFDSTCCPLSLCEQWDNVGLLVGDEKKTVKRALIALDVTDDVIEEAEQMGAELIISHHPLFLKPLSRIDASTLTGRRIMRLIGSGIAVISLHTNMDVADGGVGDMLAKKLELRNVAGFSPYRKEGYSKVVTFVPPQYAERVKCAMIEAGGGKYGKYEGCAFVTEGRGCFTPEEGAKPFTGTAGEESRVDEARIEMIVADRALDEVIERMKWAHPYEEPAYDVFDDRGPDGTVYLGRIGELPYEMEWEDVLAHVKLCLGAEALRYCSGRDGVKKMAVAGGACASICADAFAAGADVFVTADLKYHDFLDFSQQGRAVIDAGHFPTENMITERMAELLRAAYDDVEVRISEVHCDAVRFYV